MDLVLEATSTSGGGGGGGGDASVNNVVVPIPGASAVTTAVIGSGFKCDDGYKFCGFLPSKKNERIQKLESLTSERSLLVFFVSPHKLVKTLEDVAKVYSSPPRRVCVARELTKRHEEFFRGTSAKSVWMSFEGRSGERRGYVAHRKQRRSIEEREKHNRRRRREYPSSRKIPASFTPRTHRKPAFGFRSQRQSQPRFRVKLRARTPWRKRLKTLIITSSSQ